MSPVRLPLALPLLLLLALLAGCSSSSVESRSQTDDESAASGEQAGAAADGDSSSGEEISDIFDQLEPFDPPARSVIDATAWKDLKVANGIELLREQLKSHPPLVDDQQMLSLRNTSPEENEKIYSALRRLPASDDEVDWDATFLHHLPADAKSLNPVMKNLFSEFELIALTGLELIRFDASFTPFAPDWAIKSWQISEDRLMDKFVLRDDLTWSDGTPVTAHDVAFTFQAIMNPRTPIPAVRSQVQKLRWVHAYDDQTVVIFHKRPMASWTENIQFPIIPKHIYEKSIEEDPTMLNSDYHVRQERQPVTCGPYEYVKRIRGQEILLRRRESFYMHQGKQVRDKPYFKEIRAIIIPDPNTTLLALKAGDLDEARLTAEQWLTQTSGDDFFKLNTKVRGEEWTDYFIEWNLKDPLFGDKRVRKALAYAFDHEEMIKSVLYGLAKPGTGVFDDTAWMASKNIKQFAQDLDKAEDLLDEAGWADSDDDGVRDKMINGRRVPFEFTLVTYQQPSAISVCTLLKENLDQIGIICHVKPTEFTVKSQLAIDRKFQALMGGWGTGTDPATLDNIFKSGGGRNHSSYANPRIDELFNQGDLEFDREKRAAIYAEIHEILFEDQPYLWLFHRYSLFGVNKGVRGFNFSPRDPFSVEPGFHSLWKPKQN